MISQTAVADIEQIRADGLEPTIEDIVRLNAFGLKLEAEAKKRPLDSTDYLPRVAVIPPSLSLRQPAIGHEIWLAKIRRLVADDDPESILAVNVFALSRAPGELPDADDIASVKKAVEAFCRDCRDFTRDQLWAAVDYALLGASPIAGESPASPPPADDPFAEAAALAEVTAKAEDWNECVAAGVLAYGQIVLFGASVAELSRMTRRQVRDMILRAYTFHGLKEPDYLTIAQGDYYATLHSIRERLTKEKETKDNG